MGKMEKIYDIVIFVGAGLLVGVGWWFFYVQPHNEFNTLVRDCMIHKDDRSVQSYEECVDETRPTKKVVNQ